MVRGRRASPLQMVRTLLPTVVATLAWVIVFVVIPIVQRAPPSLSAATRRSGAGTTSPTSRTGSSITSRTSSSMSLSSRSPWRQSSSSTLYRKGTRGIGQARGVPRALRDRQRRAAAAHRRVQLDDLRGDRLHDRPLFYIVPLWLVLLFVWLADGAPRPLAAAALGAGIGTRAAAAHPVPEVHAERGSEPAEWGRNDAVGRGGPVDVGLRHRRPDRAGRLHTAPRAGGAARVGAVPVRPRCRRPGGLRTHGWVRLGRREARGEELGVGVPLGRPVVARRPRIAHGLGHARHRHSPVLAGGSDAGAVSDRVLQRRGRGRRSISGRTPTTSHGRTLA